MIGPLSGIEGIQQFTNLNNIKNFNNPGVDNIEKLDDFLFSGDNLSTQGVANNDIELQADLKGLVERTEEYNNKISSSDDGLAGAGEVAKSFSNVLGNYITDVNSQSRSAEKAVETFASGGNIDLHSVMIASEKAGLSMQLAMQMRNKILQAYQEVSRTQV
jgi:flagellar hook-basal body complex protein FliE